MMGFYRPTAGQMMVDGHEVGDRQTRATPTRSGSAWSTSISPWCRR